MTRVVVMGAAGTGMARFRKNLLADLAMRAERVYAVADYERERDRRTVIEHHAVPVDLPLQRAGLNPLHELGTLFRIARVIRKTRPDLVLLYTIKPVIYGGLVCRALGIPSCYGMITGIGSTFEPTATGRTTLLRRLVEKLYRTALGRMRKVIFQNEDNRRLFVDNGLVDESRTVVVPGSGVDPEEFRFHEMPPLQRVRFLYLGRYLTDKGFTSYLNAARRVHSTSSGAEFFVAGRFDPRSREQERQLLRDAVGDGVVRDLGFIDDVAACLRKIHVLVLPSHGEGVPRSVLEAMAIGRAIVTTDAPGCRDTVEDGENGRLVPTGDDARLAEAMRKLVEERERLPAMGRLSRDAVLDHFSVARINRLMLEVMEFPYKDDGSGAGKQPYRADADEPANGKGQQQTFHHSGQSPATHHARDTVPDPDGGSDAKREQNAGADVSAVERATSRDSNPGRRVLTDRRKQ